MVLFQDETIFRKFPVLRRSWSLKVRQASMPISGQNARQVLFCAQDPKTGRRITFRQRHKSATAFQDFLRQLGSLYSRRLIWLLLDGGGFHKAWANLNLAAELNIVLVVLPKQAAELNAVD